MTVSLPRKWKQAGRTPRTPFPLASLAPLNTIKSLTKITTHKLTLFLHRNPPLYSLQLPSVLGVSFARETSKALSPYLGPTSLLLLYLMFPPGCRQGGGGQVTSDPALSCFGKLTFFHGWPLPLPSSNYGIMTCM